MRQQLPSPSLTQCRDVWNHYQGLRTGEPARERIQNLLRDEACKIGAKLDDLWLPPSGLCKERRHKARVWSLWEHERRRRPYEHRHLHDYDKSLPEVLLVGEGTGDLRDDVGGDVAQQRRCAEHCHLQLSFRLLCPLLWRCAGNPNFSPNARARRPRCLQAWPHHLQHYD